MGATTTADEFNDFAADKNRSDIYNGVHGMVNEDSMAWKSEFQEDLSAQNVDGFENSGHFALPDHSYAGDSYDDGAEVRLLLSDPSFVAITDVYDTEDPTSEAAADLFSQNFSEVEKQAVSSIRSSLPQPPVHHAISPQNSLNLQPNFNLDTFQSDQSVREPVVGFGKGGQSSLLFPSLAEREQWFSEWNDVLSGYTDEVWGELLPEVRVAKKELEEAKTGSGSLDTKAIARLKMILGHVGEQPGALQNVSQSQQKAARAQTEEDPEASTTEFHCPYISCHERFHNMWDLRQHSNTHRKYSCPHISCIEAFTEKREWVKHIGIAHHDLLDTGMHENEEERRLSNHTFDRVNNEQRLIYSH
jgi:hypothetical protein